METQVYFSGIREAIVERLDAAVENVLVAVAWLTDRTLFDALVSCQRRGIAVSLAVLDDRINRQSSIGWERLTALGGRLSWIPEGTTRAGSLHHKFCLIDDDTVINGSFNWTYRASSADENVIVIKGDPEFAAQFRQAFLHLLDKHGRHAEPTYIDRAKLATRLAIIAKLLELEDFDDLAVQVSKLEHAKSLNEIADLISRLNQADWSAALALVKVLLERGLAVTVYQDARVEDLRWQVRLVGVQVLALEEELAEMHRQIHLFDFEREQAIGDLIRRYLDVRRHYLKHMHAETGDSEISQESEAAESTYQQYENAQASRADEPEPAKLNPIEQAELKQLFRKLAMKCHPDRVLDDDKTRAKALFQQVQAAYQNNDLKGLHLLKHQVKQSLVAADESYMPDQADQLQRRLAELQELVAQLTRQLAAVGKSATWQTLSTQSNWDLWFAHQAEQLQTEIEQYESALDRSTSSIAK